MTVNLLRVNALVICAAVLQATAAPSDLVEHQQNGKRSQADEAKIVAYAKQLDVRGLDATLPKRLLADWMRESGAPTNATHWSVELDTSMMGADPPLPLCVEFRIVLGDAVIWGSIEVGNERDGVIGQSRFRRMTFARRDWKDLYLAENLSELPGLIARAKQSTY